MIEIDLGNGVRAEETDDGITIEDRYALDETHSIWLTEDQVEALFYWLQEWRTEQWRKGKRG